MAAAKYQISVSRADLADISWFMKHAQSPRQPNGALRTLFFQGLPDGATENQVVSQNQ